MQCKLTIQLSGLRRILAMSDPYAISSRTSKTIHFGNPEFACWQHKSGYTAGFRKFGSFTFCPAKTDAYRIKGGLFSLSPGTDMKFSPMDRPRSKRGMTKADAPEETLIKGYLGDFSVAVPKEHLRLGYYAGFGEKNRPGFGWCELL